MLAAIAILTIVGVISPANAEGDTKINETERQEMVLYVQKEMGLSQERAARVVTILGKQSAAKARGDNEVAEIFQELAQGVVLISHGEERAKKVLAGLPSGAPGTPVTAEQESELRLVGRFGKEASRLISGASAKLTNLSVTRFLAGKCGKKGLLPNIAECLAEAEDVLATMRLALDTIKSSSQLLFTSARIAAAGGFTN